MLSLYDDCRRPMAALATCVFATGACAESPRQTGPRERVLRFLSRARPAKTIEPLRVDGLPSTRIGPRRLGPRPQDRPEPVNSARRTPDRALYTMSMRSRPECWIRAPRDGTSRAVKRRPPRAWRTE